MVDDSSNNNRCLVTSLPDSLLLNIASFSDPPAIYSLAQTCSEFHRPSTELSNRHILSPAKDPSPTASHINTQTNIVKNVASRMLIESQIQGLVSVLQRSNASITLNQARQLAKLQVEELKQGRSVLLSGSTLVQAVTGKCFDNFDLDIYCVKESLPALRRLLADHFGLCCQSALPDYEGEDLSFPNFNNAGIHHVETYILPNESTRTLRAASVARRFFRAHMANQAMLQGDTDVPVDHNVDLSYLNKRNEFIYKLQKKYKTYRFPPSFPITLSPKENGPKVVDVIVCKSTPEQTIENFDLEICKCTFDGHKIHIVSRADTFNLRTKADHFTKLGNHYMRYFLEPSASNPISFASNDEVLSRLRSRKVTNDMIMHIMQSFLRAAQMHKCKLPLLGSDNALLSSNTSWMITPRYFLHLHNEIIKRFKRVLKYLQRDIDIPMIDDALRTRLFRRPEIHLTSTAKRRKLNHSFLQHMLTQHMNEEYEDPGEELELYVL